MKRYPDHLVQQARRMAADGVSQTEISRKLSIEDSTVSIWCRGVSTSIRWKSLLASNQNKRREYLESETGFIKK
jgi:DNA invertase Pin-like site-specific DNA recombinase